MKKETNSYKEIGEQQGTKESLVAALGPFDGEVAYALTGKTGKATMKKADPNQGVIAEKAEGEQEEQYILGRDLMYGAKVRITPNTIIIAQRT